MIPVLTGQRIREADAATITNEPISSLELMERAAEGCTAWFLAYIEADRPFKVVVGMGNNGGDGLAIARLLRTAGRTVSVVEVKHRALPSGEQKTNRDRWLEMGGSLLEVVDGSGAFPIADDEVVIDALLGVGVDRPLSGLLKSVVQFINRTPNPVYSIDLPSGLFSEDNSGNDLIGVVQADVVLAIGTPKLALLLPENEGVADHWVCIPIQLDAKYLASVGPPFALLELVDVRSILPRRSRFQHKGRSGHALLVAGSSGKWGAAVLAAKACARSGVGLISMALPADIQMVMLGVVPEVMAEPGPASGDGPSVDTSRFSAVGIGPGIGTNEGAARMLKALIQQAGSPLVMDADALNLLADNRTWLAFLPQNSILTPHPKEFDRLTETSKTGYERLEKARAFASKFQVVLVLKGAHTAICAPDGSVCFNSTGNPGMAKGGSGDALTGIITGLLAQGIAPLQAALAGVYLHGMAGDLAAAEIGWDALLPSDLIDHLPLAFKRIRNAS